ncbi:hypothetical protein ABFS83_08G202100 [Erythranthe nasuta]
MERGSIFLIILLFSAGVFLMEDPRVQAVSCFDISPVVMQCASFALGAVSQPSGGCCNEVSRLNGMASSTDDKRLLCNCFKSLAPQYPNVKDSNLNAIPQNCGVSLSFSVSSNTDCNTIT